MKYFRSYRDAAAYCKNSGSNEKPAKVNVWLDMSWTKVWAVRTLVAETSGVYGLHLNGDPSPWEEILEGGRFERISSLHVVQNLLATRQPKQPQQPEPPADLVQDSVASEPVGYLYTNMQSGEYHVSDDDDDYRGPERVLWCIEPVYRRAKGQS